MNTTTTATTALLAASLLIATAAPASAVSDHQSRYMADVKERGGIGYTDSYAPGGQTLGDAVCTDLHKGNAAASGVIGVSNDVDSLHGSMANAEVAVYWAITDLCTDALSQRLDHWKDGN